MFNQALSPDKTLEWYVSALFHSDQEEINKSCLVYSILQCANLLLVKDDYQWMASSLIAEKSQFHSLMETHRTNTTITYHYLCRCWL